MSKESCYLVKDVQVACSLCMQFTYTGVAVGPFHIVCDDCCSGIAEIIARSEDLEANTRTKTAESLQIEVQTYTCRVCGDVFLNKGSYARHYRNHKSK